MEKWFFNIDQEIIELTVAVASFHDHKIAIANVSINVKIGPDGQRKQR